jgi:radical SAM-linked protein
VRTPSGLLPPGEDRREGLSLRRDDRALMVGDKHRFRFAKAGDLRLLSHLDLARCIERMLRRATLPFRMTAGFHPAPRIVFALALPLGVAGHDEVLEIEYTSSQDAHAALTSLNAHAPAGLSFHRGQVVPMKASAVPRRMVYTLRLPADRHAKIQDHATMLTTQDKVWVDRLKPNPRRLNIRPYLRSLVCEPDQLRMDVWVTSTGTARPDELLTLLGCADLMHTGDLSRATIELHDETPPGQPDEPPTGPAETAILETLPAQLADEPTIPTPMFDEQVVE